METVYVPATEGMTPAQVGNMQTFLDAIGKDCGWDGKFIVLPPGAKVGTDGVTTGAV